MGQVIGIVFGILFFFIALPLIALAGWIAKIVITAVIETCREFRSMR